MPSWSLSSPQAMLFSPTCPPPGLLAGHGCVPPSLGILSSLPRAQLSTSGGGGGTPGELGRAGATSLPLRLPRCLPP